MRRVRHPANKLQSPDILDIDGWADRKCSLLFETDSEIVLIFSAPFLFKRVKVVESRTFFQTYTMKISVVNTCLQLQVCDLTGEFGIQNLFVDEPNDRSQIIQRRNPLLSLRFIRGG